MIERVIHQIWHPFSSPEMPRDWRRFSRSWRRLHPAYEHVVWGPEESRRFVADHHPGFLELYDGYRDPIQRVDTLRVLLLQRLGGVYVDLDVECLRPVDALLEGQRIVIPAEPPIHADLWRRKGYRHPVVLSTAFMASEAGHPFWSAVIDEFRRSAALPGVMDSTGPFVVTRCYEREPDRTAITVAPADTIYPVDGRECGDGTAYDLEAWVRRTRDAHAVHHWASTWNRPGTSHRPARRPYPDGLPTRLRLPTPNGMPPGTLVGDGPLVSCVMLSRGWANPARFAIECFRNQTYRNRELVVVTTNDDGDLRAHVRELGDSAIRILPALPHGTSTGAMRNVAIEGARGELVCTWDDDDLSGADRLAASVTALLTSGAPAAFLERACIWWPARRRLAISGRDRWEKTMIARRAALSRYPEREAAGAPGPVVELAQRHALVTIDDPNLYVEVVWEGNAHGPEHFQRALQRATFDAEGADYERALSVVQKHVPVLDYLEWLQRRDPRTFDAPVDPPARLDGSAGDGPRASGEALGRAAVTVVRPERFAAASGRPLRFLFAWELGGGLGHTVPLSQLARPLLDAGHEVHLALLDLSTSRAALGELAGHPRLQLWQAPRWPATLSGAGEPASHAEMLFHAGYLDHRRLIGLVDGWDTLFRHVEPELLLADNAPTALLAARGRPFKRALAGTGFFMPAPEVPMPSFREWEPIPRARLEASEEVALRACNAVLAARRLPPMKQLHELYSGDERFLLTVPELDHFAHRARDPAQTYWGALPPASHGQVAHWPSGIEPAVFAYLKPEYGQAREVLRMLRNTPWRILAFVPALAPAAVAELATEKLQIVTDPVDMAEICATCDVVLCHSGSGTVTTALLAGRPTVLLPMHVEQLLVARRVQGMGAGLYLLQDGIQRLPEALRRVLAEPSFRDAARAFARRHASPHGNRVAEAVAARCVALAERACLDAAAGDGAATRQTAPEGARRAAR